LIKKEKRKKKKEKRKKKKEKETNNIRDANDIPHCLPFHHSAK
jgi:hypothetical protein